MNKKPIKYIDNDRVKGVAYDWATLVKETNKLIDIVCEKRDINPSEVYHIESPLDSSVMWYSENSARSMGKTTAYLILGMIAYTMYGMRIEYIRTTKDAVAPVNAIHLFDVIIGCNYINEITDGRWSNVYYKNKEWYFCNLDEKGDIEDIDINPFCHMHNLQTGVESTKSSYNSPQGDLIIYDECVPVSGVTTESYWLMLCQLLSTITRQRISSKFILLANCINPNTHLFHELDIVDDIRQMKEGESRIVKGNVPVWVHIIGNKANVNEKKSFLNLIKFGFKNPKLKSITGGGWEIKNYPHYPKCEYTILFKLFFNYYGNFLACELREHDGVINLFCYDFYNTPREDDIIYCLTEPTTIYERYGFTRGDNLDKLVLSLIEQNLVCFSANDIGGRFHSFINEFKVVH